MQGVRLPPYPQQGPSVQAALRSSHPGLLHALTDEQLHVWQRAVDLHAVAQTHQKYVAALTAHYRGRFRDAYWAVSEYHHERDRLDRYLPSEGLPSHLMISAKDLLSADIQDPPPWDRAAEMGFRQWAVSEISVRQISIPIQPDEKTVGALVPDFFAQAPFHTKGVITAEDLKRHFKTEYHANVASRPELAELAAELRQLREAQGEVHRDHAWRSERNARQPIVRRIAKLLGSGGHDYPLQTMWKRPEDLAETAESALAKRRLELALPMIAQSVQETKVAIKRFTDYEKEVTSGAARALGVLEATKWLGAVAAGLASGGMGLSASALVTGGYAATQDVAQQTSGVAFGTQQRVDVQQTINQAGTAVAMALIGGKLQSGFKSAIRLRLDTLPSLSAGAKEFMSSLVASGTSSVYTTATQSVLDHVVSGKALPKNAEDFADLILKEAVKSVAMDVGTFHLNAKLEAEFQAWRSGRAAPIESPGEPIGGATGHAAPSAPTGALHTTAIRRLLTQSGGWTRLHAELTSGTGLGQGLTPGERTRLVSQFEVHRQILATDVARMYDGQVTSGPGADGTPDVQVRFTGDDAATRAAQAEAFLDTKEPGWRASDVAITPPRSSKAAADPERALSATLDAEVGSLSSRFLELFHDWAGLTPRGRLDRMMEVANAPLAAKGYPRLSGVFEGSTKLGPGAIGEMHADKWSIVVKARYFEKSVPSPDEFARAARLVAHEARHALQWVRAARVSGDQNALESLHPKVKAMIEDDSPRATRVTEMLIPGTPAYEEATRFHTSIWGEGAKLRTQILSDWSNRSLEVKVAAEEVNRLKGSNATRAEIAAMERQLQNAEQRLANATTEYKALPEEADAYRYGDAVRARLSTKLARRQASLLRAHGRASERFKTQAVRFSSALDSMQASTDAEQRTRSMRRLDDAREHVHRAANEIRRIDDLLAAFEIKVRPP